VLLDDALVGPQLGGDGVRDRDRPLVDAVADGEAVQGVGAVRAGVPRGRQGDLDAADGLLGVAGADLPAGAGPGGAGGWAGVVGADNKK